MIKFCTQYFLIFCCLLLIEVLIALFVHDNFIRPYIGDFLVVILIYCFVRSFLDAPVTITAIGVFLFACIVETAQYFHATDVLGLQNNRLAKIIIGSSFEWLDIVAYALGIFTVILIERMKKSKSTL